MRNKWMVWGSLLSVFLLIVALYHLHITNTPVVTIQNKGDIAGNYIGTFYVTGKFYQWTQEAIDKAPNRIEALPVWWHKQNKAPLTDTITALLLNKDCIWTIK